MDASLLARLTTAAAAAAAAAAARWRALLAGSAGAALAVFLAKETYKSWPMSYHFRLFALLARWRFFPQPLIGLDVPIVSRGRVRLSDLDYHGHVNNAQCAFFRRAARCNQRAALRPALHAATSFRAPRCDQRAAPRPSAAPRSSDPTRPPHRPRDTYPTDALDADLAARYPWMSAVLMQKGKPYRANAFIGGAAFFFVREMRWGARYRIETRCVGVDAKWLYIESHWLLEVEGAAAAAAVAAAAAGAASGGAKVALTATVPRRSARTTSHSTLRSPGVDSVTSSASCASRRQCRVSSAREKAAAMAPCTAASGAPVSTATRRTPRSPGDCTLSSTRPGAQDEKEASGGGGSAAPVLRSATARPRGSMGEWRREVASAASSRLRRVARDVGYCEM